MDIILIHTGTEYPHYINDCILQLKKYKHNVHLIISKCLINMVTIDDIKKVIAEDYIDDKFNSFDIKNYDKNFRDGFWLSTSNRFFLLNTYTTKNKILNFFHIENDNLLFTNLVEVEKLLSGGVHEMSVVVDSEKRCIPSIMFFKSPTILNELCDYILRHQNNNDMENIFHFFNTNRDRVLNLPIIPHNYPLKNTSNNDYSNQFSIFNSIFDGAAIGQYLGGVDPRNDSGNTIGFINETTIFNPSNSEYEWEDGEIFMVYNDNRIKINNLHIHSKNLEKFIK